MPEVSVVIPAFNAAGTLRRTLYSVLSQTFRDYEVIVVDDGSTDATAEVAAEVGVRCLRKENAGVSRARNDGVAETSGPLVAFLDADDLWHRRKLERQVEVMRSRPEAGVCFTAVRRIDECGRLLATRPARDFPDVCAALLLMSMVSATCSSGMVRRQFTTAIGGFDPAFSQCADWDYWLRLSRVTRFVPIDEPYVDYRVAPGRMSTDISLLERDTFAVLAKFFAGPDAEPYAEMRRRCYSNHWMILSGSYLETGRIRDAARCLARGVALHPANATRAFGLPGRHLRRLIGAPG